MKLLSIMANNKFRTIVLKAYIQSGDTLAVHEQCMSVY